jgi:hypothetical protein
MYIPSIPAHIVQRGNNRNATFSAMTIISDTFRSYIKACSVMALNCMHIV